MNNLFWLGMIAATLTTIAFLPQVIKVFKTRHTKDLSLVMFLLFSAGLVLWIAYGILSNAWPVIIANIVTLGLSLVLLGFKIKYG